MFATRQLSRATASTTTTTTTAQGKRAMEELAVYLRGMRAAQRRWSREILAHESHVRRLMLVEEQCRDKLKQQVLKGTREHLKYLTNTDLMAVSQFVSPPSVESFLAYGIAAEQMSGFTVYVMGCLGADPNRLSVPLPMLMADLSSAWAVLPPTKRDAFTELAEIFRPHLPPRTPPATSLPRRTTARTSAQVAAAAARRKVRGKERGGRTAASRTGPARALAKSEISVAAKTRKGRGAPATTNPTTATSTATATATATAAEAISAARGRLQRRAAAEKPAPASASRTSDATSKCTRHGVRGSTPLSSHTKTTATATAATTSASNGVKGTRRSTPKSQEQPRHVVQFETDAMEAFARQLPPAEYEAFSNFAQESLREMELALGASLIPVRRQKGGGGHGGGNGAGRGVAAHSPSLPRGVRLFMKEWLPIAAEEWVRKTRRQRSFYMRKS